MRAAPPIETIVQTIVDEVRPHPVVLFGSYARGDADEGSDVYLMVEMETPLSRHDRRVRIDALFPRRTWGMDVVVYTPEEIQAGRDATEAEARDALAAMRRIVAAVQESSGSLPHRLPGPV
jgi:predicted nucleotidyltransferase